jgi:hypothetical protein
MFVRDNREENFLTKMGVKFKYSNSITFQQLVPTWEDQNQGRSKSRVEEVVLEYAARTEAGSNAPAPILRTTAKGLDPLDGVQRLGSEKLLGSTNFSAYIVETDSNKLALSIRIMANHLLAGHPEPVEWTKRRAIQMLAIENDMSLEEVARLGGWKIADVQEEHKAMTWGFAIRCNGGPDQLPKGVLLALDENAKMDDLRVATKPVVEFISDLKVGKFSNGDSKPHIERFFAVNRKDRKNIYEQFEKKHEEFRNDPEIKARLEGRKRCRLTPEIELRRILKTSLATAEKIQKNKHHIPYMEEFFQLWNQVRDTLSEIAKNKK